MLAGRANQLSPPLLASTCACPSCHFPSDLALTARLVTAHGPLAGLGELLVSEVVPWAWFHPSFFGVMAVCKQAG
jgi:hypothetical protein